MNQRLNHKLIVILASLLLVVTGVLGSVLWKKKGESLKKEDSLNTAQSSEKKPVYTCPMHPGIKSDHPDNCPICHMALQRVDEDEPPTIPDQSKDSSTDHSTVPGRTSFSLSQEKQQLIGVTTAKVERRVLGSEIRATGRVAFDPELYTAVEEYRQAIISRSQMMESPYEGLKEQADEMVNSSRTKLKLMGLTDSQIKVLSTGKSSAMSLLLPKGKVWVYAEIFEFEMAFVKVGQKIEAIAPSAPSVQYQGTVTNVSPLLNAPTRTVRVSALVPDPKGDLRPDTFLNVKIKVDAGDVLAIPQDAVLHSGDRAFVFVVKDKGKFQPRAVSVGRRLGEYYEVLTGLSDGETIVTAANFLIDSESRLRSALQNMESSPVSGGSAVPPGHEGHSKNSGNNP